MLTPILFYLISGLITVLVVYLFLDSIEQVISHIRRKIPLVPSTHRLRRAVTNEINAHFSDLHTVCDIGSGYGGLVRRISRKCSMSTVGLENMPFAAFVSKTKDVVTFSHNKTIWCDAFEYLGQCDGFDIAVAYMGPGFNEYLYKYQDKFKVLITLVIPADNMTPTRIITLPRGYTRYGMKKYPHKLYVYDLR